MKFYKIDDIEGFFRTVDKCKGRVELLTEEGDRLNLKSQLTKCVSLATFFSGREIKEMEILTSDPGDMDQLVRFCIYR